MKQLSFCFRAIVALVVAGATLITPVNAGVDPKIPRPQKLALMSTTDFVVALEEYRALDTSVGHSQPGDFADALESVIPEYDHEQWNGSKAYTIRNPGPSGVGIIVMDLDGKSATLKGKQLVRDQNDKLVAIWLNEDYGVYSVHDAVTIPAGVSGFMLRLDGVLDHATMFSFWNGHDDQHCKNGANRAIARQTGQQLDAKECANVSGAITTTASAPVSVTATMSTVVQFESAVAGKNGNEWLAAASKIAEASDGTNRVQSTGNYVLAANICIAYWGTDTSLPNSMLLKSGNGWVGRKVCAANNPVTLNFPHEHSGVLLSK